MHVGWLPVAATLLRVTGWLAAASLGLSERLLLRA